MIDVVGHAPGTGTCCTCRGARGITKNWKAVLHVTRTTITDSELARRVGTSTRMIVYVRRGERKMSPELRQRMAEVLGVSTSLVELVLRGEAR